MPAPSNRTITLLLNRNVESLGIVGDVVKVKPGYARNYLLPLGIAEAPTEEKQCEDRALRGIGETQLRGMDWVILSLNLRLLNHHHHYYYYFHLRCIKYLLNL